MVNIAFDSLGENYPQIFTISNAQKISEESLIEFDKLHYSLENKLVNFNKSMIEKLKRDNNCNNYYKLKVMVEKYESL